MMSPFSKHWCTFKRPKPRNMVAKMTNVVRYDNMGYPLRLFIMANGDTKWIDTYDEYVVEDDNIYKERDFELVLGDITFPIREYFDENHLSEEFLSQLSQEERDFIESWKELYESKEFQNKIGTIFELIKQGKEK